MTIDVHRRGDQYVKVQGAVAFADLFNLLCTGIRHQPSLTGGYADAGAGVERWSAAKLPVLYLRIWGIPLPHPVRRLGIEFDHRPEATNRLGRYATQPASRKIARQAR
ncbi:hypothetical protein NE236_18490 [Actinoallomurus purpureus]|uniref:hypothetical protein n=1 Tax=Actinoallomurus purpureus TaxID=478114 RepID=UPI002092D1FC|nr:hypothetical protein [Actinoallomurus purpureus]MCO6006979.1 hypothetical protein [Actinoallomurus purpureus]